MAPTIATLTVEAFGRKLRSGAITSRAVTEDCLRRIDADIEAKNGRLNAFIRVMADEARAQAKLADEELARGIDRGPLHGVPISVKDLLDVQGTPTTAASRVREGHIARRDAAVIGHLRQAGAVLVGKTNLHEFAFGTTNEESAFGPAHNPHDITRSPGGSSGGSAISVVTGMALASIGTDTGGSIRIPAAACGIVGLKPAFGEVSTEGIVPLSRTLDHVGPLTQSVTDAWLLYRALLGDNSYVGSGFSRTKDRSVGSGFPPSPGFGEARRSAMRGGGSQTLSPVPLSSLRLAIPRTYFCELLDDEVRARFDESLERLRAAGARIDETDIPHSRDIAPVYITIVFSDAAAYHAATLDRVPERYSEMVRARLEVGRYLLAEDLSRALNGREVLRREVNAALEGRDALVLPTLPIPAPRLGAQSMQIGGSTEPVRNLMLRETQLFNLTGHPAISLPCGTTAAGLPCGLQLVGARNGTEALLRVASACELHLPRTTEDG
jgi:aspartyl-tRNA(Asn)/glutamyl-tRNA(Gln) amidotransferase subunit A